jgi:hypothetical protein
LSSRAGVIEERDWAAVTAPPSAPQATGTPQPPPDNANARQRRMLSQLVVAAVAVVFLVYVVLFAFGSPSSDTKTATDTGAATGKPMPSVLSKGLEIAVGTVKDAKWGTAEIYDATGQDRSFGDKRNWQVCFQAPAAGATHTGDARDLGDQKSAIDDHAGRDAGQVWLGVVKTDESCTKLGGNYGVVQRVYNLDKEPGSNVAPNLYGYTPHMARIAFGDDASIRVLRLNGTAKSLKALIKEHLTREKVDDGSADVSGGWEGWKVCQQNPQPNERWDGRVVTLKVVDYDATSCAVTKS